MTKPAALRREIAEVRRLGYALNRGEFNAGIVGVAIPVRNREGAVAGAVNVNWMSVHPMKNAEIKSCLEPLHEAAKQIEVRLSTGPVPSGWMPR